MKTYGDVEVEESRNLAELRWFSSRVSAGNDFRSWYVRVSPRAEFIGCGHGLPVFTINCKKEGP